MASAKQRHAQDGTKPMMVATKPGGGETVLWLNNVVDLLEHFRTFNPDVTVNTVLTFLTIADNPGITPKEVMTKLGMRDSGQSRTVAMLSRYGDRGRQGWDVIEIRENEQDRRYKNLYLNRRGELLLERLNRAMLGPRKKGS